MTQRRRTLVDAAWVTGALAVLLVVLRPVLDSRFGIVDDHEIVEILGPDRHLGLGAVPETAWHRADEPIGRFRPVYWLLRVLESALWGPHVELWYAARLVLAAVALVAVFVIARRYVPAAAAAALAVVPFAGPQAETWYRLGPNEAYALPLLLVGLCGVTGPRARRDGSAAVWWAYLCLVLAAGAKESFVPLSALVIVACGVLARDGLTRRGRVALAVPLLAVLALGIGVVVKVAGHGDQYAQQRDLASAGEYVSFTIRSTDLGWHLAGAVAVLLLAVLGRRVLPEHDPARSRCLVVIALAGLLAVGSQVVFYAGAPQVGRYLYPLALLPVLLWVGVLGLAGRTPGARRSTAALVLGVLLALVPVSAHLVQVHRRAADAAVTTRAFARDLALTESRIVGSGADVVVLQPSDPVTDTERVLSLSRYLVADLSDRLDIRVMTTPSAPGTDDFSRSLAAQVERWSRGGSSTLAPFEPGADCVSLMLGDEVPVCDTVVKAPG